MTGYLLLAISLAASVAAYRWWTVALTARGVRWRDAGDDFAEVSWADLPGRRLPAATGETGLERAGHGDLPGGARLAPFPRALEPLPAGLNRPWLYFHYAWSLAYWLALLGFPALFVVRHRLSRERGARGG